MTQMQQITTDKIFVNLFYQGYCCLFIKGQPN